MFWNRKSNPEEPSNPEEILRPGTCECEHMRCAHEKGKGMCHAQFPPDEESPEWTECACQIFILDDDGDDDPDPETPTPSELLELYQR